MTDCDGLITNLRNANNAATAAITEHDVTVFLGDVREQLGTLAAGSVQCIVTSPPYYGLRDYGVDGQIGLEPSPAEYVAEMVGVFREARRVLADDGVLWLNLGDSYAVNGTLKYNNRPNFNRDGSSDAAAQSIGSVINSADIKRTDGIPQKNLLGIPWRVAFGLQDDGWTLRNAVIWNKPNAMPESVTDRLSCRYEHVFLFSKSRRYSFDLDPIREPLAYPELADGSRVFGGKNKTNGGGVDSTSRTRGGNAWTPRPSGTTPTAPEPAATDADGSQLTGFGTPDPAPTQTDHTSSNAAADTTGRNPGDVWTIATSPFPGAHFATMPAALAERCILAGCPTDGTVLDPFAGSGTTLMTARKLGRKSVGVELNPEYIDIIRQRIGQTPFDFGEALA